VSYESRKKKRRYKRIEGEGQAVAFARDSGAVVSDRREEARPVLLLRAVVRAWWRCCVPVRAAGGSVCQVRELEAGLEGVQAFGAVGEGEGAGASAAVGGVMRRTELAPAGGG
jgi:hypothetical protein